MRGIDVCRSHLGLDENIDRKEIMILLSTQAHNNDINIDPSKTSWCAAWMNFCERSAGNLGSGKLNAQSYNVYGHEISPSDIKEGDILIFHFPSDNDWQGHVTYFSKYIDPDLIQCIGGNQNNKICLMNYHKQYLKHIRRYP